MKKIIIIIFILLISNAYAKHMDDVYNELIKNHKNNNAYVNKVKNVQKKYHEFLDAQAELFYPAHGLGTAQITCGYDHKQMIDKLVIKETLSLFTTIEGDACKVYLKE